MKKTNPGIKGRMVPIMPIPIKRKPKAIQTGFVILWFFEEDNVNAGFEPAKIGYLSVKSPLSFKV
jgi:hypothetical protein